MTMMGEVLRRGRIAARRAVLSTCGVLLVAGWFPAASGATGWLSTQATLPANARISSQYATVGSVSCGAAGDCGAGGTYVDSAGRQEGLLATETAGVWQPTVEAATPPGYLHPYVTVTSVSCPAAGSCSAVGDYADGSNYMQGLLLTESSGTWQAGIQASPPPGALSDPNVSLSSVSCVAVGECTAVGRYADSGGHGQGLLLTETAGVWGNGVMAVSPANTDASGPTLTSVSCPSVGNCAAVGYYRDTSSNWEGVLLTETNGVWQPGQELTPPANALSNPYVRLNSLSCTAAGECSAVGRYADGSSATQGLLVTQTAGAWQSGTEASVPANAASSPDVTLNSVSCAGAGECSAVGTYTDGSSPRLGLLVTQTSGAWQSGTEAILPANAQSYQVVGLNSVSCVPGGECTAAGSYADGKSDTQEMWLTESAGTWGAGVESPAPGSAGSDPGVLFSSVSCPAAQQCSAVGRFNPANPQGLLAAPLASPALSLSAPASALPGGQVAPGSVSASLSGGSSPSGTVTFSVYGPQSAPPSSCAGGGTTVGTAIVSGDGTYHPSSGFTPAGAGDYWWYASYGGDMRNSPAASACGASMAETVVSAPSGPPGPTATATALRSSTNPSVSGQRVTYTATVSPAPDGGTVRFIAAGQPLAGCAAVPVNPGPGTVTCATTYQRPGAWQVQAVYGGDANFSTSQSAALKQTIRSSLALVRPPSGRSGQVSLKVSCARGSGGCVMNAALTTTQILHIRKHGHIRTVRRVTVVGSKTVKIAAGKTVTVAIKLNSAGRKLLAAHKRLPVKLTLVLVVGTTRTVTATRSLTVTPVARKPHHHG